MVKDADSEEIEEISAATAIELSVKTSLKSILKRAKNGQMCLGPATISYVNSIERRVLQPDQTNRQKMERVSRGLISTVMQIWQLWACTPTS